MYVRGCECYGATEQVVSHRGIWCAPRWRAGPLYWPFSERICRCMGVRQCVLALLFHSDDHLCPALRSIPFFHSSPIDKWIIKLLFQVTPSPFVTSSLAEQTPTCGNNHSDFVPFAPTYLTSLNIFPACHSLPPHSSSHMLQHPLKHFSVAIPFSFEGPPSLSPHSFASQMTPCLIWSLPFLTFISFCEFLSCPLSLSFSFCPKKSIFLTAFQPQGLWPLEESNKVD